MAKRSQSYHGIKIKSSALFHPYKYEAMGKYFYKLASAKRYINQNSGRTKNPIAMVKGFVPVQVVGNNLVGKVTNPGQKRAFKKLVGKIKRALR